MFERLLERIAVEFESRSIPYLIIGGQAVLVHGEPRLTQKILSFTKWSPVVLATLKMFAPSC